MKTTEVFFPFEPRVKQRPRFTRYGHAYTPKATQEYEKQIAEYYMSQTEDFYDSAIKIRLIFNMPIPKSITKKKRIEIITGQTKCIVKKDIDNMVKAVLDGLNSVAFSDDKLITKLTAIKQYAPDDIVGTLVTITEDID